MISPCPHLPEADHSMDWRSLNSKKNVSGIELYLTALKYAQVLWMRNLPARAVLAIDRALLSELNGDEAELITWPLPYGAMSWVLENYDEDKFVGNPRIHFQHLATRVKGKRKAQRKWRAWASWFIARQARPHLPGDTLQAVEEPNAEQIGAGLRQHGLPGELENWEKVVIKRAMP